MGLENRADPTGELFRSPTRGLFTGNRGIIHDPDTKTRLGRRWTTKGWISCTLTLGNRRRDVWARNRAGNKTGWSELFFLDEVSALAAGHRPCFFCRRPEASAFRNAWINGGNTPIDAPTIDRVLHGERWLSRRTPPQILTQAGLQHLPDATMIEADGRFYALRDGEALSWDFSGYLSAESLLKFRGKQVRLVTPPSILKTLREGYQPHWHDSAEQTPS